MLTLLTVSLLISCGTSTTPEITNEKPTNLTAVRISRNEVQLTWQDNSTNEAGFLIQKKEENDDYQTIQTTLPEIVEIIDEQVDPFQTYYYRVAAEFYDGFYNWSNVAVIYINPTFDNLFFGTDSTFDVITWNIQEFPKNGSYTLENVQSIIQALNVDVIALQEIESSSQFTTLKNSLSGWDGFRANSASYNIDLAYLYNTESVDNIQINEILGDINDSWFPFPRTPLLLELDWNSIPIKIINNHLKAGGDSSDEDRRRDAAELLDDYISQNFYNMNVIILGDLNDEIDEPEASNVFWSFISKPQEYYFVDTEIAEGSSDYWSYPSWPSHLDHILITNELFGEFANPVSEVRTIQIDDYMEAGWQEYDDNVSDHLPVGLKLAFE